MKQLTITSPNLFNHCATVVCAGGTDLYVAHYGGSRECEEDQHVILTPIRGGQPEPQLTLEWKTGNPVLFQADGRVFLGYSLFERMDVERKVLRWAFCSLWTKEVKREGSSVILGEKCPAFKDHPQVGFLFRCSPIRCAEQTILPVYREASRYGSVVVWTGERLRTVGRIGRKTHSLIQPSLWHDGQAFHALCRNMVPETFGAWCWYSTSPNLRDWSPPVLERSLTNYNNSVVVVHDGRPDPLVIWNRGGHRRDLSLGKLRGRTLMRRLGQLNRADFGSYPNYCFDEEGGLHLVWTEVSAQPLRMMIKLLSMSKQEYEQFRT